MFQCQNWLAVDFFFHSLVCTFIPVTHFQKIYLVLADGGNGIGSVKELAEWNDGAALATDDAVVLE